jgi:Ca2+-binding EF-hand superfamily protein
MSVRPLLIAASALALALGAAAPALARSDVANIFFSPSGEPFRGGDKDDYAVALWFAKADANHDGTLSKEEFRADANRFFAVVDVNHDGRIDAAEVKNYETKIAPEVLARSFDSGDAVGSDGPRDIQPHNDSRLGNVASQINNGQNRQGAGFFSFLDEPEPISGADIDFNNKVTKEEWLASAKRRFSRLDPEGTGGLTLKDLPKTPIQIFRDRPSL